MGFFARLFGKASTTTPAAPPAATTNKLGFFGRILGLVKGKPRPSTVGKLQDDFRAELERVQELIDRNDPLKDIAAQPWYALNSSNVDRVRYADVARTLQVVFKNGALYEYDGVEPDVFMGLLRTHSPGQFVWYVLRAYGYPYRRLDSGLVTSHPAKPRFDERPFAVPAHIEELQRRAGRGQVDERLPVGRGIIPPPPAYKPGRP